jgi:membrane protein
MASEREREAQRGNGSQADEQQEPPQPQPERGEQRLRDPRLRDLTGRDRFAILKRAGKEALDDNVTDAAAAIAYYAFLALPAILLLSLGLFSLLAGPGAVNTVLDKVAQVAPEETVTLLRDGLTRAIENQGGGIALLAIGVLLGVWTVSGAMTAVMRALNRIYERDETRGFVRQRVTAVGMFAFAVVAFALAFGLLVLGPYLSDWIGSLVGLESVVSWVWWAAQWPILIGGLLLAFAAMLYLGPNVDHPRWQFLTPGAVFAVAVWLLATGLFAVYVSMFGSYNKAWGSLAAVVIMLTWLWLSALALLVGAEVNAEAERSRELRRGEPAEQEIQAPAKA